jgi:hypothetical protein
MSMPFERVDLSVSIPAASEQRALVRRARPVPVDIAARVAAAQSRVLEALVARYGPEVGGEAADEAIAWALGHTDRLQRVGTSLIDGSQKHLKRPMVHSEKRTGSGPVRVLIAGLLVALGGATIAAVSAARRPSNPIIGMTPKAMTSNQIFWLLQNNPSPDDTPSWYTLVTVDGSDAVIAEATNNSVFDGEGAEVELSGKKVRISETSEQSSARWKNANGRSFNLTMAPKNPTFRIAVEAVVASSTSSDPRPTSRTTLTSARVREVETWDLLVPSLIIQPKALVGRSSGFGVASIGVPTSEAIAQRMLAASGESAQPFRAGRYLVIAPADYRDVRPLRASEFLRTVEAVDRDRSAEIEPKRWTRIAPGVDFAASKLSDFRSVTCARTATDVACSRFLLNRRLGSRWVYSTAARDVRVDGGPRSRYRPDSARFTCSCSRHRLVRLW